jgi:hypothetical protein
MKSQDILLLLKLSSLHKCKDFNADHYSVRSLAAITGISKTEIGVSINRSIEVGLARHSHGPKRLDINNKALLEFISYGLRYVFPAKPGPIVRGMITSFEAPGLEGLLSSMGEHRYVWPDALSNDLGQEILPLYKTAPFAARNDAHLYQSLALVDAIRIGRAREISIAKNELKRRLQG